ncbi:MAG: ATP-binding protein [Wenzhouxiangellaceae bacterium]
MAGWRQRAVILLPWLLAAAYVLAIAQLAADFAAIDRYQVDHIDEIQADGSTASLSLGFLRRSNNAGVIRLESELSVLPGERPALFLPRFSSDVEVRLNGHVIRSPNRHRRARHSYRPLFVPLPAEYLEAGSNRLQLNLISHTGTPMLSRFYLGSGAALEPVYQRFAFWRIELLWGAFVIAVMFAILMLTIWLVRPQLREYGWIGLAFAAFALFLDSFVRTTEPHYHDLYRWLYLGARAVFLLALIVFIHRFLQLRRPRLERSLAIIYGLVFSAGLVLIAYDRFNLFLLLIIAINMPLELLSTGYIALVVLQALRRRSQAYLHWFLAGGVLGLALGLHDLLVLLAVDHWLIQDFYISQYAIVFVMLGYGGVMVHRVAHALLSSEELNQELSRQLQRKTEQLEQEAEQRIADQKQLTLAQERQRILADMHDGVGGQLNTLLAATRGGSADADYIAAELEQIVADLRLMLDTMSPAGEDLLLALARLRERYQPLFRHAGIALHWQIDPLLEAAPLAPNRLLNALRIVQEALHNTVKHAAASEVMLTLRQNDAEVVIEVTDNGRGLQTDGYGYGLTTMRQRAQNLFGQIDISNRAAGGVTVRLQFPLSATPRSQSAGMPQDPLA